MQVHSLFTLHAHPPPPPDPSANALALMTHLDTALDGQNPGASRLLEYVGIELTTAAWKLSSVIPNVISVTFNPSGSKNNIQAAVLDLAEAIAEATSATPVALDSKAEAAWLKARSAPPVTVQHGAGASADAGATSHADDGVGGGGGIAHSGAADPLRRVVGASVPKVRTIAGTMTRTTH